MIALNHITKYSNIFVRYLRIFEYIRTLTFQWSEYSNIFVFQFFYIRIRISNIRPKIFEYSNIFEYSLRSAENEQIVSSRWAILGYLRLSQTILGYIGLSWALDSEKYANTTNFVVTAVITKLVVSVTVTFGIRKLLLMLQPQLCGLYCYNQVGCNIYRFFHLCQYRHNKA